ncbi:MAG: [protein-PII] uridylyltransferase [Hyphomicrobiales bacterium]|nr:[protein-PII] uridylyltransferase [Hyphomicrobiales bacterium]
MDQAVSLTPPYFDPAAAREELTSYWLAGGADAQIRGKALSLLKSLKATGRAEARRALEAGGDGRACAEGLAALQDEIIRLIYDFAVTHVYRAQNPSSAERMTVVATGGYGRGLLAPGSDVDLLFLLPYRRTAWGESVAEYILYFLWDLGYKVGHATRTIEQTVRYAKADFTIRTSLLDARRILGDEALFDQMRDALWRMIGAGSPRDFIDAKLKERDHRHTRTGASRYRVEPNIKDGKGGLRDLHTLHWLASYLNPGLTHDEFVQTGLLSADEYRAYRRCEGFLWTIRCHLHFLAGKAEERLTFDLQPQMAARLRYKNRGGLIAAERFMKHYFLVAKEVGDLTRTVSASLEVKQLKAVPSLDSLLSPLTWRSRAKLAATSEFRIDNNRMTVKSRDVFARDPSNMVRLFAMAERYKVQLHPDAVRLLRASLRLIDDDLRADPEANRLFLDLLTSRANSENSLRDMNEAGVLGRFIPDFGRVVSMMQFNMYHHYTVDEHLIQAVGVLSEIEAGALSTELPLSTEIIGDIQNRRALYVALFLHDVAKGRDEDHSTAGAAVARSVGSRLGLSPPEAETAAWLVENHLVMSQYAQSRDISDPKTIRDFAAIVQSPERLKLLTLLTVADIRAVGPGIWNGWKGQLLRALYYETEPLLAGGHTKVTRSTQMNAAHAALREALRDWPASEVEHFISRMPPAYWLRTDAARQTENAGLMRAALTPQSPLAYDVKINEFAGLTELTIYARDNPRLLSMLAGACAAAGANIVSAQIATTTDGAVLDVISLQKAFPADEETERAQRIVKALSDLLRGERSLDAMMSARRRPKPALDAFTVRPQVVIDNSLSEDLTVIEVNGLDRPGLLFDITAAIAGLEIDIASAHVATFGEKAVDVFYVADARKQKITKEAQKQRIRERILAAMERGADKG